MSQENVEIVQAGFAAWNAGDMNAFRDLYDADVVMRVPDSWPEPGPFVGREAVMREFERLRETWATHGTELITDIIDAPDRNRVVVRQVMRGVGSDPESQLEFTIVFTVSNGRTIYQECFWDHAEALEVAGLSE